MMISRSQDISVVDAARALRDTGSVNDAQRRTSDMSHGRYSRATALGIQRAEKTADRSETAENKDKMRECFEKCCPGQAARANRSGTAEN
jgi:hypothetical protein